MWLRPTPPVAAVTAARPADHDGWYNHPLTVNVAQAREYADAARRLSEALDLSDGPSLGWVMGQSGVLTREEQPQAAPPPARLGMGVVVAAFIIGLLTGAAGLFAAAWLVTP